MPISPEGSPKTTERVSTTPKKPEGEGKKGEKFFDEKGGLKKELFGDKLSQIKGKIANIEKLKRMGRGLDTGITTTISATLEYIPYGISKLLDKTTEVFSAFWRIDEILGWKK